MDDYITTGVVGAATAAISTLVTWLSTRRQYLADVRKKDAEAEDGKIGNYDRMLAFYQKLCDDISARQEALLRKCDELRVENAKLREGQEALRRRVTQLQSELDSLKGGAA